MKLAVPSCAGEGETCGEGGIGERGLARVREVDWVAAGGEKRW